MVESFKNSTKTVLAVFTQLPISMIKGHPLSLMSHLEWKRFSLWLIGSTMPMWIITRLTTYIGMVNSLSWGQDSSVGVFLIKPLGTMTFFYFTWVFFPHLHHLQISSSWVFSSQPSSWFTPHQDTFPLIERKHNWLAYSCIIWPHYLCLSHWIPLGNLVGSLLPTLLMGSLECFLQRLLLIRLLEILILVPTQRFFSSPFVLTPRIWRWNSFILRYFLLFTQTRKLVNSLLGRDILVQHHLESNNYMLFILDVF